MAVYKLLDPIAIKMIDEVLENQYHYIEDEQERRRKIKEMMSKSEEEILRRIPVTLRQRILNARADKKNRDIVDGKINWLTQEKAKAIFNSEANVANPIANVMSKAISESKPTFEVRDVTIQNNTPVLSKRILNG